MNVLVQVTDFAGGTNFMVVALITLLLGGTYYDRQVSESGPACADSMRVCSRILRVCTYEYFMIASLIIPYLNDLLFKRHVCQTVVIRHHGFVVCIVRVL